MPSYIVTNPQTGQKLKLTGDAPPSDQELDDIFSSMPQPANAGNFGTNGSAEDIPQPMAPPASPAEFDARKAAVNEPTLFDKVKGAGEAALTLGTGATTGLMGNIAGAISGIGKSMLSGTYGTQEGADAAQQEAMSTGANLTYEPRTQVGKDIVGYIGEKTAGLEAVAPFTRELSIIGQGAKSAIPKVNTLINPAMSDSKINTIYKLRSGDTENTLAPLDLKIEKPNLKDAKGNLLPEAFKIVDDDLAKEAIKQGFEDGLVQAVKTTDDYNVGKMLDMLNVSQKGKKNTVWGNTNRPTDVIGDSFAQNLSFIKSLNKKAGEEIDSAARSLSGKSVDVAEPVNNFINTLSDKMKVNIVVDESGKIRPDFRGSDIEGKMYAPEQRLINNIVERMGNTKAPDAYDVHRLKRAIDQTVTYGKTNSKSMWPDAERAVKSLRNNLDGVLDSNFESYNKANTKYADTVQALDSFQNVAGKKIDLFGEGAEKQIGTTMRGLLSNIKSRQELTNSIKNIHEVSNKYGNPAKDDPMALITFANELDNMFGPAAKSSLAGEQSIGTKAALRNVANSRSITELGIGGVQAVADKMRGVNQDAAYKSMRDLLARQKQRKAEEAQKTKEAQ